MFVLKFSKCLFDRLYLLNDIWHIIKDKKWWILLLANMKFYIEFLARPSMLQICSQNFFVQKRKLSDWCIWRNTGMGLTHFVIFTQAIYNNEFVEKKYTFNLCLFLSVVPETPLNSACSDTDVCGDINADCIGFQCLCRNNYYERYGICCMSNRITKTLIMSLCTCCIMNWVHFQESLYECIST